MEEITATFRREVYRKPSNQEGEPDWTILECEISPGESVKVTAETELNELKPALTYRFYGSWSEYNGNPQFTAKTFVQCEPHGREGVVRYLRQADGIGTAIAQKLWEKFGGQAVKIVRTEPEIAQAAVGKSWSLESARFASEFFQSMRHMEDCFIDLTDLLGGHGFPKTTAKKAIKEWGNRAAQFIRHSPYHLMSFRGCGFLRCDKLYLSLGKNPTRLKRQAYCAWYSLARNTEGHTWFPVSEIEKGLNGMIGGCSTRPVEATKLAIRAGLLGKLRNGSLWVAEGKKDRQEQTVAEIVARLSTTPGDWPSLDGLDISDHQREELGKALHGRIAVFSGSPGTGKTYSSARLISALIKAHGREAIAVAAPTGKASVRITELMRGYGLEITAGTIHSLLGVAQNSQVEGWSFQHTANYPLPVKYVIVDESSMIDTTLMASLLSAIPPYGHVLFVGDPNQLPPVGHGAPIRDFIAAGIPSGELREIRRNSGSIVRVCASIRDGDQWEPDQRINPDEGCNLGILETSSGTASRDRIVRAITNIKNQGLIDPIWGCQVIVAVNKKSALSRAELNKLLQAELNPAGQSAPGNPFRAKDKIVCLKNGIIPGVAKVDGEFRPDGDRFIANGELGEVIESGEKHTIAKFDDRLVKIPRGKGKKEDDDSSDDEEKSDTGCNFDLGYAISAHKSQGSEFPVVFVALDDYPGAMRVCSREWVYTAISRAKKVCYLVGQVGVAKAMCNRVALKHRKTFLAERIREAVESILNPTLPPQPEEANLCDL